ncbi:copper resistance D domain protein [Methylocella silvestris BL2]|uniref:Copper resistance D domain protein n=1 Tax=Methylocella silvestris (strain DSM 15510 / CIP 108128 / LMG 27833 / NCIMB 13906 / BL2) TaxID=395965 RepID=B8EJN6_METSB|nr:CopD family protein [Methylocella silvestris]ACK49440.1 copper resistance D domain protein [Methylocella silvestris BL2]
MMTIFDGLVVARFVHFSAVFALFGASLFWLYAFPRLEAGDRARPSSLATTRLLLRCCAVAASLSGLAWLTGSLADMTSADGALDLSGLENPANWRSFFLETDFGPPWIARLALLGAALAAVWPWRGAGSLRAMAVIGALLLISQAFLGHAAQGGATVYGLAMVAAYVLHLCAAAAWAGGLAPLLFVMLERDREGEAAGVALTALLRFSVVASIAAPLAVATGAVNAWFRIRLWRADLAGSPYFEILLAKATLVVVMLILAAINRFVLTPRLRANGVEARRAKRVLSWTIAAELAAGLLVLVAAANLGLTPPPG